MEKCQRSSRRVLIEYCRRAVTESAERYKSITRRVQEYCRSVSEKWESIRKSIREVLEECWKRDTRVFGEY